MQSKLPIVLTIAGSDSSSGAGIQADLKTFTALKAYGVTVISVITAQNTYRVDEIYPLPTSLIYSQIRCLQDDLDIQGIKIGMLYSSEIIQTVVDALNRFPKIPIVVDPLMISTSGYPLLKPEALAMLTRILFPKATLITPNLKEVEALSHRVCDTETHIFEALLALYDQYKIPILATGGDHPKWARDYLIDSTGIVTYESQKLLNRTFHGTGCTYASAILTFLTQGIPLRKAIARAKKFMDRTLKKAYPIQGDMYLINHMH